MIAHNGEINTVRGNINWMRARESQLASELFGDDLHKVLPLVQAGGSDSATFDNVLELLVLGGRSLPHAMMMMIPEATAGRADLPPRAARVLRLPPVPDGGLGRPGRGVVHGRPRDRLDARPQRPAARTLARDARRLGRARLRGRRARHPARRTSSARAGCSRASSSSSTSSRDGSSRTTRSSAAIATQQPYADWFDREVVRLADLPPRMPHGLPTESLRQRQIAFGYSLEDMKVILAPLARNAEEAVSSMGNDTPLAVLSDRHRLIYSYFKQLFAQVTNPPIDSIREAIVMSLQASIGSEKNLFHETPEHARQLVLETPDPARLRARAAAPGALGDLQGAHARHDLARRRRPGRDGRRARPPLPRGRRGARRRHQHPDPLRPRRRPRARGRAVAARDRRRAPPPRPRGHAPPGRPRRRVGRGAQRPQRRDPDRLRRRGRQPVPDARDAGRARRARVAAGGDDRRPGAGAGGQGARQGAPEDALQDGDLDDPLLLRGADLRGRRSRAGARRAPLHRHRLADRRRRHRDASRATCSPATRAPIRATPTRCCP